MSFNKFKLGDIVSLTTNPYYDTISNLTISGDATTLSPLMVVVEAFVSRKKTDTHVKYKCIWFSVKSQRYSDALFFESDLKIIKLRENSVCSAYLQRGDSVFLKTLPIETRKRKSHQGFGDTELLSGSGSIHVSALLSFASPILQVVEVISAIEPRPAADKHSGKIVSIATKFIVKCRFYDSLADRFAIAEVPIDALDVVDSHSHDTLTTLDSAVVESHLIHYKSSLLKALFKPLAVVYRNGYYYTRAEDYVKSRILEFKIDSLVAVSTISDPFFQELPTFNITEQPLSANPDFIKKEFSEALKKAARKELFVRIKYKNRNEHVTERTIKQYEIVSVKEKEQEILYISAFCCLRNAMRSFRIDRVQSLNILKLNYNYDIVVEADCF